MDIELDRLTAAARRIGARVEPRRDRGTGLITLPADSVRDLLTAVSRTSSSSIEANQIRSMLGGHRGAAADQSLPAGTAGRLSWAILRMADEAGRAERIARGQYPGPMSASEAVKFLRGRAGR